MSSKTVNFEVDTKAPAYWIAVDNTDIKLNQGKGSVSLKVRNEKYTLYWWFEGDPGTTFSIVGKVAGRKIVEVKDSKVPKGQHSGGGRKRFKVA